MSDVELPEAVASPCNECPWRKESAAGWLGPYSAKRWARMAHGESPIACHKTIRESGSWEGAKQCAGAAAFRANVFKTPRNPEVVAGPPRDDVFSDNESFIQHHTNGQEHWETGDMYDFEEGALDG